MEILSQQEAAIIFKAITRLLDLRNNFINKYKHFKYSRCSFGIDNENRLFTKCANIKDIRKKYNINEYYKIFKV